MERPEVGFKTMMQTEPTVEPAVGQIYEASRRGEKYQIIYVDDQVVFLRCDTSGRRGNSSHRMEQRSNFDDELEAGFFEHLPDSDLDMMEPDERDWADVAYIGKKTAYKLHRNGFKTALDVQQAENNELLEVDGLGKAGLDNLREFVQ